jgi:hypothetical protein
MPNAFGQAPDAEGANDIGGALDKPLAVTFFKDATARTKREELCILRSLADRINTVTAARKADLPWLKLARFGEQRTDKNSLRHDDNVLAISGIEGDYDGGVMTVDEVCELLTKQGLAAVVYTSPSHTEDAPHWRVLCPTSLELAPGQRVHMVGRLNGLLGGIFSGESFTLSQSYYFGSVKHNPSHRVELIEGVPIDLHDDLDEVWTGKPQAAAKSNGSAGPHSGPLDADALVREIMDGTGYHQATVRLAGHFARHDMAFMDARKSLINAMDCVPDSERDSRWHKRRTDLDRVLDDIYGKEARKRDAAAESGAQSDSANIAPPPLFDPWAELQPPTFPIDALPPVLRAFAEDRARVIGADPCALAWAAISAASAALDGSIRLKMKMHDTWAVPPAIWVALVGRPSTKKTPVIKAAWEPLQHAQNIDLDHWRQQLADWKALPKNGRDTEEPKPRRRLVSHDGTMEALQDILGRQDRGIGVLRDELSGWMGSLEKYGGTKASAADRAFFLQAFDGGPNVIDRVSRGTIPIRNLLVTICGGIQPDRLRQFSDLTDDGLWQRFATIIVSPASRGLDERPGSAVTDYTAAINKILDVPGATRVDLCDAAHDVRADIERQVFDLELSDVLGARFASFCGKLVGLWGRLCLVLNYLDPRDTHFIVPLQTAERAATLLFQSVVPCAARVYAATGGAGADAEATRSVAGYILTKQKDRVLASDLAHNVRACRGQPLDHVQRVVSPLVAGGWLTPEKDWNPFSWIVSPAVHSEFEARARTEAKRRAAVRDVLTGRVGPDANAE